MGFLKSHILYRMASDGQMVTLKPRGKFNKAFEILRKFKFNQEFY